MLTDGRKALVDEVDESAFRFVGEHLAKPESGLGLPASLLRRTLEMRGVRRAEEPRSRPRPRHDSDGDGDGDESDGDGSVLGRAQRCTASAGASHSAATARSWEPPSNVGLALIEEWEASLEAQAELEAEEAREIDRDR